MIAAALINDIAKFIDTEAMKIVLNDGAYEITDFVRKMVAEDTLHMEYIVPLGSVEAIEKIEIKNANDELRSENIVFVPITSDSILTQTIKVREVL